LRWTAIARALPLLATPARPPRRAEAARPTATAADRGDRVPLSELWCSGPSTRRRSRCCAPMLRPGAT